MLRKGATTNTTINTTTSTISTTNSTISTAATTTTTTTTTTTKNVVWFRPHITQLYLWCALVFQQNFVHYYYEGRP
jgi:hypothetical protein